LLILGSLTIFLGMVAGGFSAFRFVRTVRSQLQNTTRNNRLPAHSEVPVEHGGVVRPEQLQGHGKLYFVPVGKQAIPVQTLADYYRKKFGAEVTVLPPVETKPADCVPKQQQCAAEDLQAEMTTAYSEIARDPDSVMIALTDEDIFPRARGWDFTYSWHSARIGIVSTRRMDPGFWDGKSNEAVQLANTRQMLTKYVALEYYHVPSSFDPTSVMRTPLVPNGGPDDIYESDLHSEESVNGRRGSPSPCLFFSYSYETHKVTLDEPVLSDCDYPHPAHAGEETFDTNLGWGHLTQRSLDLDLASTPRIAFRRGYTSGYPLPVEFGMGWGVNHSFNAWLGSNGLAALTYLTVIREDGSQETFKRLDQGQGFNSNAIYESHEDNIYGARLTWHDHQYKVQYRDGSFATFLECDNPKMHCYWVGYQDAKGNTLHTERSVNRDLQQVSSSDNQGIGFRYDDHHRIVSAEASDGKRVSYEYDSAGCLSRVERSDGQVAVYEYDAGHRMTSFSVAPQPGAAPETVLSNQYDAQGRLIRQELAGVGAFSLEYMATRERNYTSELRITDPSGRVLMVSIGEEYVVHATNTRFPAARH